MEQLWHSRSTSKWIIGSDVENLHISQTVQTSTQLLLNLPWLKADNNFFLSHRSDYYSNLSFIFSLFPPLSYQWWDWKTSWRERWAHHCKKRNAISHTSASQEKKKRMQNRNRRIFLVFSLSRLVVFYYYFSFQERSFPIIRYYLKLKENKTGTSKELYVQFLMGEKKL